MPLKKTLISATLVTAALGIGSAHALEQCQPFSVTAPMNEHRVVKVVKQGSDAPMPGDLRIGHSDLVDNNGNAVGSVEWETRVLGEDDAGQVRLASDVVLSFENGNLYARSGAYTVDKPVHSPETRTIANDQTRDVLGGSGVFEDANGKITFSMQENGDAQLNVNITCT
ncbi:hypothetical protein [Roseibium sp.]|uniref:hypothetical protein n=1 Tax=Roseibium sp. TaxID=1936156 RepID=UPI003B508230